MKKTLFPALGLAVLLTFVTSSAYATLVFQEDFETDLDSWVGKSGGAHHGQIVTDPLDSSNNAMNFLQTNSAGDIFTSATSFLAGDYVISFDYLGVAPFESGGYVGISQATPGSHKWLWATGTVSNAAKVLIDDGVWHSYTFSFTADWDFNLMLEDFSGASPDVAGNAYFDNMELNAVPEPTTMLLFGTGIVGLAAVGRRRRK